MGHLTSNMDDGGLFLSFIRGSGTRVARCVSFLQNTPDCQRHSKFSFGIEASCLPLSDQLTYFKTQFALIDDEDQKTTANLTLESLTTYLLTHQIHILIGSLRKFSDPSEFTFINPIYNVVTKRRTTFQEFQGSCTISHSSCVAKLGIISIVLGEQTPSPDCLLKRLKDSLPPMDQVEDLMRSHWEKGFPSEFEETCKTNWATLQHILSAVGSYNIPAQTSLKILTPRASIDIYSAMSKQGQKRERKRFRRRVSKCLIFDLLLFCRNNKELLGRTWKKRGKKGTRLYVSIDMLRVR